MAEYLVVLLAELMVGNLVVSLVDLKDVIQVGY